MQIAMDSYNHYEQQLYAVFKSFDKCGEEALERSAVINLCDALQLEARGKILVDQLFASRADRVTFAQFRASLLRLLGAKDTEILPNEDVFLNDNDLSDREVAPKIVFGKKKYGRRSRPQRAVSDSHLPCSSQRACIVRSSSAMAQYSDNKLTHDSNINYEQAVELCSSLHMDSIDPELIQSVFKGSTNITLGEFFQRLDCSLSSTISNNNEDKTVAITSSYSNELDSSVDKVVEIWEQAGVQNPTQLLHNLGFHNNTVNLNQLESTLNLELRLHETHKPVDNEQTILLLATLALAQMQFGRVHSLYTAVTAERDKLRADLSEANSRMSLLAHEIDENQTRLESDLKKFCQQLESRHANETKRLKEDWFGEREKLTAALNNLQKELTEQTSVRSQQHAQIQSLKESEKEALQRCMDAEEIIAKVKSENVSLQSQLIESKENLKHFETTLKENIVEAALMKDLKEENKRLQDRVDELFSELESRRPVGLAPQFNVTAASLHDEAVCQGFQLSYIKDESACSLAGNGLATVDAEVQTDHEIDVSKNILGLNHESSTDTVDRVYNVEDKKEEIKDGLKKEAEVQVSIDIENNEVMELKRQIEEKELAHSQKVDHLHDMIDELEKSLEMMKEEYDKCEEYWSGVVEEERARAAHAVPLPGRSTTSTLPPIEESGQLEAQVADLEREHAEYKKSVEVQLVDRQKLVEELEKRVQQLEAQIAEGHQTQGEELNEQDRRVAEYEMCMDRLVASDLLIKDLFIENCQLFAAISHHKL